MSKKILSLGIILVFVSFVYAQEEQITITTYYPSPYGSYNELYVASKLGIGTTEPKARFEILDADDYIRIFSHSVITDNVYYDSGWKNDSASQGSAAMQFDDGAFHFYTRPAGSAQGMGSERVTVLSNGDVGIGTANPQGLLDVNSGSSDTGALFVRADPVAADRGGIIHHQGSIHAWQEVVQQTGNPDNGYLTYHYVNRLNPGTKIRSDVMTVTASGNVGIGTVAPTGVASPGNNRATGNLDANDVWLRAANRWASSTTGMRILDGEFTGTGDPAPINTGISAVTYPNATVIFRGANQYDGDRNIRVIARVINNRWFVDIDGDINGSGGDATTVYYTLLYW